MRYKQSRSLLHSGVIGMKWGQHLARRDAKKYLNAKYSHGDGAGVKRRNAKYRYERNSKKYGANYKKTYNESLLKYDTQGRQTRASAASTGKAAYKEAKSIAWRVGKHTVQAARVGASLAAAGAALYQVPAVKKVVDKKLRHSGVKGMKWGVRKAKGYVQNKINLFKDDRAVRRDNTKAYRGRKHLSDSELRARTQRLRLENDYKREIESSKRSGITKEVWKAIKPVVTAAAVAGATAYVGHRINNAAASHKFKTNGKISPSQAKDIAAFMVKAGRNKAEGKKNK